MQRDSTGIENSAGVFEGMNGIKIPDTRDKEIAHMRQNLEPNSIKFAKPAIDAKPFKLTDSGGLYLMVNAKGKYWRYNYRFNGKHKTLALGVYPDISLKNARDSHSDAKSLLRTRVAPCYVKKQSKLTKRTVHNNSFEAVAREWFTEFKHTLVESHAKTIESRMERDSFTVIGERWTT